MFAPIAAILRGPPELFSDTAFYFTVLDGYRGRIASLGSLDIGMEPPSADPGIDRVLAERLSGRDVTVPELVEQIVGSGVSLEALVGWANTRLIEHGQGLSASPSRVEQCLGIAAAREGPSNPYPGEPGKWRNGFFCIDEYLGDCPEMAADWLKAVAALDRPAAGARDGVRPELNEQTAPFLIAEYLHFRRPDQTLADLAADLRRRPTGLAVLPFRIFGQFRAAGVWLYRGPASENETLLRHVGSMAGRVEDWITPTIERAFASSTIFSMLETLHGHDGTAPLIDCENFRQSLFDLWFATGATICDTAGVEKQVDFPQSAEALAGVGSTKVKIPFGASADPDAERKVHDLLGCQSIILECPLLEKGRTMAAITRLAPTLRLFETSVGQTHDAAEHRRTQVELEVQKSFEDQLKAVSGEMLHAFNDLMSLSAEQTGAGGDALSTAERQLQIVRHLNQQLFGYAHIVSGLTAKVRRVQSATCTQDDPSDDGVFFRDFIAATAKIVAFSEHWQVLRAPRHAGKGFDLQFTFRVEGGETQPPLPAHICHDFRPDPVPDPTTLDQPPWPLTPGARWEKEAVNEVSAMSALLWGPMVLLRSACRATAVRLQNDRTPPPVMFDVRMVRDRGCWTLSASVEHGLGNDNQLADEMEDKAVRLVQELIPDCSVSRTLSAPTIVLYRYDLLLRTDA